MAITLTLTGKNFVTAGVKIGDEVQHTNAPLDLFTGATPPNPNGFAGKFLVTAIGPNVDTLTYDGFLNGAALGLTENGSATGTVAYKIIHNLTKDEQIDNIIALVPGLASKRVTLVWPPAANVMNDDGTTTLVDGTFMASCLASAKSANPAQQGFTNNPIPGPYELLYSNKYFNKSQLKRLSNAGVFVFMQDTKGANIYALRQRTTDTTTFINSELSCVTAEDKVSVDIKAMIQPFIGPYDITDDLLSFFNEIGDAYFFRATTVKAPKCGPLVISGKIDSVLANIGGSNPTIPDGTTQVTASIELGKPNNWTTINLLVS